MSPMRGARDYLEGFVQLAKETSPEERRSLWRQSMATLATAATDQRPVPLEGLSQDALLSGVRVALDTQLVDDLAFLSAPAAAAGMYELAAALPPGAERRELGRRVLGWLHSGNAATFVSLATALAMTSRRGLAGPGLRSRVALALDLPIGSGTRADALALALISHPDLLRDWVATPSMGSLPSRRLAARLIERAAREAARRVSRSDDGAVRLFDNPALKVVWQRLLADRESLVWRHIATARGLLAHAAHPLRDEIDRDLDPSLTPTEWRRAAASLAASMALTPDKAVERIRALLGSEIVKKDRGVPAAVIFGLHRAAESEPLAAESVLEDLVKQGGTDAAEALVDLLRERIGHDFGAKAASVARSRLLDGLTSAVRDDGTAALHEALVEELIPEGSREPTLRDLATRALLAFADRGARDALVAAEEFLGAADYAAGVLEHTPDNSSEGRRAAFRTLRELDAALFEISTLPDLLAMGSGGRDGGGDGAKSPLNSIYDRVTRWLLERESDPVQNAETLDHTTLRLRRLRALLHLIDADGSYGEDRSGALRERRVMTMRALVHRVRNDAPSPLRRTVTAAMTRAADALVREEIFETSDVLLVATLCAPQDDDLTVVAEATLLPDFANAARAMVAASKLARTTKRPREAIEAMLGVARTLPAASSPRVEALRTYLLAFARALDAVIDARSLGELVNAAGEGPLVAFEAAAHGLAQIVSGARRRVLGSDKHEDCSTGAALRLVLHAVERGQRGSRESLADAVSSANETLREELPAACAITAAQVLSALDSLPETAPPRSILSSAPMQRVPEAPLPAWLPAGRTLGGFYVLRTLGTGAGGSVFAARRAEERYNERAERFALKVPEYDGSAARTLSEQEFLSLFREEAGALLALPQHDNIARFVTFDAGARPKPILVMELVEGPSMERVVELGDLDVTRAFQLLDDVAAGLQAMHRAGVGHLDVKPSNVIIRDRGRDERGQAVLVDFGLSGRKIRPGCATAFYGAPEIWGLLPQGAEAKPPAADVYAFGCMVFELLTGRMVFEQPSEVALITAHLSHDGAPPPVAALESDARFAPLARVITTALRKDPRKRATVEELRAALADLAPRMKSEQWPLPVDYPAE